MRPSYCPWCSSHERADRILTIIRLSDWKMPMDRYQWPQFSIWPTRRRRVGR